MILVLCKQEGKEQEKKNIIKKRGLQKQGESILIFIGIIKLPGSKKDCRFLLYIIKKRIEGEECFEEKSNRLHNRPIPSRSFLFGLLTYSVSKRCFLFIYRRLLSPTKHFTVI